MKKTSATQKLALCIGINDYPGTQSDLAGCVNDANDWAKVLRERDYQVRMLLDDKATGDAIREGIKELINEAKRGDSIVIQYSGHGSFVPDEDGDEPDGTDECLCPHDVMSNGLLTDDELFDLYMKKAYGVRLLMISDSCHSGTVARFAPIVTPPTMRASNAPQRTVRFLPPNVFLSSRKAAKLGVRRALRRASPPGRYGGLLMAGCQDTEYSYDAYFQGRPNGAFSYVALDTLKTLEPNATYRAWFNAIEERLPSRQYPQTPNLFGSKSMKRWKVLQ
ncbi:MAG: caspase family protein [candidate division Zixibacteria bacterium]|nr:caspase family protein [candidate division Zixibacteria bacterium]